MSSTSHPSALHTKPLILHADLFSTFFHLLWSSSFGHDSLLPFTPVAMTELVFHVSLFFPNSVIVRRSSVDNFVHTRSREFVHLLCLSLSFSFLSSRLVSQTLTLCASFAPICELSQGLFHFLFVAHKFNSFL